MENYFAHYKNNDGYKKSVETGKNVSESLSFFNIFPVILDKVYELFSLQRQSSNNIDWNWIDERHVILFEIVKSAQQSVHLTAFGVGLLAFFAGFGICWFMFVR